MFLLFVITSRIFLAPFFVRMACGFIGRTSLVSRPRERLFVVSMYTIRRDFSLRSFSCCLIRYLLLSSSCNRVPCSCLVNLRFPSSRHHFQPLWFGQSVTVGTCVALVKLMPCTERAARSAALLHPCNSLCFLVQLVNRTLYEHKVNNSKYCYEVDETRNECTIFKDDAC